MKLFKRLSSELDLLQGNRFLKKAGRCNRDKADRFFTAAYQRYSSAVVKDPRQYEAYRNWGHGYYNSARAKSGKEQWRAFKSACEKYETAHLIKPDDYDTLKFWALALRGQAQNKREKDPDVLYRMVYEKLSKAAEVDPKADEIYYQWGLTFYQEARSKNKDGDRAKHLCQQACEKFKQADEVKAKQLRILNDWGTALMALADHSSNEDKQLLLSEAQQKFVAADAIDTGIASYNLACFYAVKGNEEECRKQLMVAKDKGTLPALGILQNDPDLKSVRKMGWFKSLIASLKEL